MRNYNVVKNKARAARLHLGLSVIVATIAGCLVFGVWYPYPYRDISGGRELFGLIVAVDVVLGPLITFVVFNPSKQRREMMFDLSLVVILQLSALLYGLWSVYQARPIHTVFEYDRFRVIHAIEVPREDLGKAPIGIDPMPLAGPTWLSLRPLSVREQMDFTMAALSGLVLAAQPTLWQPYEAGRNAIQKVARPATELKVRFPEHINQIDLVIRSIDHTLDTLVYLPLVSRNEQFWTVLLDQQSLQPLGWLPLDSF